MITLNALKNTHKKCKKVRRIGRGMGSKRGKTCGRGSKGDKSRRGYKTMAGREGGQLPLYKKLPCRGFSNGRFRSFVYSINLERLNELYEDGELVSLQTLQEKGVAPRFAPGGLKILSQGELKKKVKIEAAAFSAQAEKKLGELKISFTKVALSNAAQV